MKYILPVLLLLAHSLPAQEGDSLRKVLAPSSKRNEDILTISVYERVIRDAKGNIRYDENIVSNFKLNSWLRAEAGFRLGHRPQKFDSYYHYKLELQTKSLWKTVRFLIRLSNDVTQSAPEYARSYYIAIAEVRRPFSKSFSFLAAYGHVLAAQRDNSLDGMPAFSGSQSNYTAYKIGLRYALRDKGFVEGMCGNYDIFNPFAPSNSFLQTQFEYDLSRRTSFTSNLRYQFDHVVDKPFSYVIIAGVKLHF